MNIYTISGILLTSDSYIDLINESVSNTINFISYDEGALLAKSKFKCQSGYTLANLDRTDIYDSTSGNLHVFSKKFYTEMSDILKDEMIFFEADLIVSDTIITCYVAKVINIQNIIDDELSEFDFWDDEEYDDEEPLITDPVFVKNILETQYCVKHITEQPIIVFTDTFKKLVEAKGLKIEFRLQTMST